MLMLVATVAIRDFYFGVYMQWACRASRNQQTAGWFIRAQYKPKCVVAGVVEPPVTPVE